MILKNVSILESAKVSQQRRGHSFYFNHKVSCKTLERTRLQQTTAQYIWPPYLVHFCLSFLLFLSSAHRRRTISGLITGNRLCTDESLLAMQNIWFNISIFHHALTAERVNSTLQFPWTPLLGFFVYANICILSHSVQSNISLVLCLFPLLISFPLVILLIFFYIKVHKVWNLKNVFWNMNGCNRKALYM